MNEQVHTTGQPIYYETIKDRLKAEILTLTDAQAEFVLRRLECLIHEKS